MIMAERLLDCYESEGASAGENNGYKRMAVLGEMRCQQTTSHLDRWCRLSLYNPLYNHAPDPFNSPLSRVL